MQVNANGNAGQNRADLESTGLALNPKPGLECIQMNANSDNSQDRAYRHLKESIVSLELRPGERLRAATIAKSLRISRTPVREALSRLEQDGLAARSSGWGYVVRTLTHKEIRDVYRMREALEVEAAQEAIETIDEEGLIELEQVLGRAENLLKRGRIADFRKATRQFHLTIARIADNEVLLRAVNAIDDKVRLIGALLFDRNQERGAESLSQNRATLEALTLRDPAAVEKAVRTHVQHARQSMLHGLRREALREPSTL
jgi:DNA-binding GntR family transcriptional regulator